MPQHDDNPYAGFPPTAGVNPAAFLEQIGLALSMMGARNPETAMRMYLGLSGLRQHQQRSQMEQQIKMREQAEIKRQQDLQRQLSQGLQGDLQPGQLGPPAPYNENEGYALATQIGPEMLNALRGLRPALEAQGRVPHPDTMKQKIKAQGWAAGAPGIASGLAPHLSMPEGDIQSVAANVPPTQLSALLGLPMREEMNDIRQQNAETQAGRLKLAQQIENLETEMAKLRGANLQARNENLGAKTDYTLGTTPGRVSLLDEQVKALQAKYPTIAPMAEAKLAGEKARTVKTQEETKWVTPKAQAGIQGQQARTEKTKKETTFVGTTKAGKPSESDKRVAAWVENYLHGEDFADQPGEKGYFRDTPAISRREAAAFDVKNELNPAMRDIKMRAYQEAFGGQQGGATASAATSPANQARPGEEVRQDPRTGKRYVNRNGQVVEVR